MRAALLPPMLRSDKPAARERARRAERRGPRTRHAERWEPRNARALRATRTAGSRETPGATRSCSAAEPSARHLRLRPAERRGPRNATTHAHAMQTAGSPTFASSVAAPNDGSPTFVSSVAAPRGSRLVILQSGYACDIRSRAERRDSYACDIRSRPVGYTPPACDSISETSR